MKKYEECKESGDIGLGKIPHTWTITKVKFLCEVYNGNSLNDDLKVLYESVSSEDIPYIGSKDIDLISHNVNYENGIRIPPNEPFKVAPARSFLLCIEGGSAGRKIAFLNQDVFFVNKLACFTYPNKFLYYFAQSKEFIDKFFSAT